MKGRIFVVLFTVLTLSFVLPQIANAEYFARECYVTAVETDIDGEVRIDLALVSTGKIRTHVAPTGQEKAMLAVALTALTSNMKVLAYVDFWNPGESYPIGFIKIIQ